MVYLKFKKSLSNISSIFKPSYEMELPSSSSDDQELSTGKKELSTNNKENWNLKNSKNLEYSKTRASQMVDQYSDNIVKKNTKNNKNKKMK